MLELQYNFLEQFCDADKYEELERDTNSFYLALSGKILQNDFLLEKQDNRNALRWRDSTDTFTANATDNSIHRICCNTQKRHD